MNSVMSNPLRMIAGVFREKCATSKETAMTWEELGLDPEFEDFPAPFAPKDNPFVKVGKKYYLSEERLKALREKMGFRGPLQRWVQHTAQVPKGYLRVKVLHMLKEKSMSGAEMATAIEKETQGRWRPKPGSMYPLLKNLIKEGLTREILGIEGRTRKYELTDIGVEFLEQKVGQSGELKDRLDSVFPEFTPGSLGSFGGKIPKSVKKLFALMPRVGMMMANKPPAKTLKEFNTIVEEFVENVITFLEKHEA